MSIHYSGKVLIQTVYNGTACHSIILDGLHPNEAKRIVENVKEHEKTNTFSKVGTIAILLTPHHEVF